MRVIVMLLLAGCPALILPPSQGWSGDTKALLRSPAAGKGGASGGLSSIPDVAETPSGGYAPRSTPDPAQGLGEDTTEKTKKGKPVPKEAQVRGGENRMPMASPDNGSDPSEEEHQDGWNVGTAEPSPRLPPVDSAPFPGNHLDSGDGHEEDEASERRKRLRTIPARR